MSNPPTPAAGNKSEVSPLLMVYVASKVVIAAGVVALLVFAAMKLAGTLPTSLDGSTFTYMTLGFGGAWFIKNLCATKVDKDNTKWDLLPPLTIVALGVCAIFPSVLNLEQLAIGSLSVTGFIVLSEIMTESKKLADRDAALMVEQNLAARVGAHFPTYRDFNSGQHLSEVENLFAFLERSYPNGVPAPAAAAVDPDALAHPPSDDGGVDGSAP